MALRQTYSSRCNLSSRNLAVAASSMSKISTMPSTHSPSSLRTRAHASQHLRPIPSSRPSTALSLRSGSLSRKDLEVRETQTNGGLCSFNVVQSRLLVGGQNYDTSFAKKG